MLREWALLMNRPDLYPSLAMWDAAIGTLLALIGLAAVVMCGRRHRRQPPRRR